MFFAPQVTRKFCALASVFMLLALLPAYLYAETPAEFAGMEPYVPKDVPNITIVDVEGKKYKLSQLYGKPVLLNFWATWCAPCVKEMGDLDKLQADFKEDGLVVVALSQDQEGPEIVKPFFKQHALKNLKMYFDPLGEAFGAFDLSGLPASVLIDHNGKEAIRMSGFLDWNNRGARMVVQDLVQRAKTAKEKQE